MIKLLAMSEYGQHDILLDASGLKCPLPVLKARRQIEAMDSNTILLILADDPAAPLDFAHFCEVGGHELLDQNNHDQGLISFRIRKA
jgi:tRNA 2-thiouridine synthesizing protein A